jgi:hypothetical protein
MNLEDNGSFEFYNQKLWVGRQPFNKEEVNSLEHLKITINSLSSFDSGSYDISTGVWSDKVLRFNIFSSNKYDKYGELDLFGDDEPDFIRISIRKYRSRGLISLLRKQENSFYDVELKTNACKSETSLGGGTYISDNINEVSNQILQIVQYIFVKMNQYDRLTQTQCKEIDKVSDFNVNWW